MRSEADIVRAALRARIVETHTTGTTPRRPHRRAGRFDLVRHLRHRQAAHPLRARHAHPSRIRRPMGKQQPEKTLIADGPKNGVRSLQENQVCRSMLLAECGSRRGAGLLGLGESL